jgi:hypothetical protein
MARMWSRGSARQSGFAPELFLVSVAAGEGESRHGGSAAFHHESGHARELNLKSQLANNSFSL